jgi:hypothetical protein
MSCKKCMDAPCPVSKAARKMLGAWARERRRQGVGMFGDLQDQPAMDAATDKPVDDLMEAKCDCECHGGPK